REIHAGSNFESQDPTLAHFGLGTSTTASIEVQWPDGLRQVRNGVRANRRLVITEPSPDRQAQQQRRCIVAPNNGGAAGAAAVAKRFVGCVQADVGGQLPAGTGAAACLATDPSGHVATAIDAVSRKAAKACPLQPAFGPTSAALMASASSAVLRPQD